MQFKNRESINNVIDNNIIKVKENKFSSCLKKWIVRPLIFVGETYLFGLVSALISVLSGKMTLWTAFQWWNPIAIGISTIVGPTVPMGLCVVLAILAVVAIPVVKDYVIKPIIKKIKKAIELKKIKKLEIDDLEAINVRNINTTIMKNYLSCQKKISFDALQTSFEQNIKILKNRNLVDQTQTSFIANSINEIPITNNNSWNVIKCTLR